MMLEDSKSKACLGYKTSLEQLSEILSQKQKQTRAGGRVKS